MGPPHIKYLGGTLNLRGDPPKKPIPPPNIKGTHTVHRDGWGGGDDTNWGPLPKMRGGQFHW